MNVILILPNTTFYKKKILDNSYIIGVDKGALNAINNDIYLDEAIGDFDSISKEDLIFLQEKVKKVTVLNPVKDETDTQVALKKAFELSENVTILGGIQGKRIEHFLTNILLFKKYPNLRMQDENSIIFSKKTSFLLSKKEYSEYKFISIYAIESIKDLTLKGFKYELNNYPLDLYNPLCVSNELIDDGKVSISNGQVLVIISKSD